MGGLYTMKKWLRWFGITLGGVIGVIAVAVLFVFISTEVRMNKTYAVERTQYSVSRDPVSIERGRHLANTVVLCIDCHGTDFSGRLVVDDPMIGKLYGTNLTTGRGSAILEYTDIDLDKAIREGINPNGKPLRFMPSQEYYNLSDPDVDAIIAYIRSLPPVDNEIPKQKIGPLTRILYTLGELELLAAEVIDHSGVRPPAPEPGPTQEYGDYLARNACIGCHGPGLSGGRIPGSPPDWPLARNISPDPESGIGKWTKADFYRAMREGVRPDGESINELMPWQATRNMTDIELDALWEYLQSAQPKIAGLR
jgi:mono/diheme cytochrome c family protein